MASYNEAVSQQSARSDKVLRSALDAFQDSADFGGLAKRTQSDYRKFLKLIDAEFGDFPIDALEDRRTRGEFLAWRDRLALKSRRQSDYAFSVLARAVSWSLDRGLVSANPCKSPGRLYRSERRETIWTDTDESAFKAVAPDHLWLAFQFAVWTGQRQGDLIRLEWNAFDGTSIRLRQGKTGARVAIRIAAPLLDLLGLTERRAITILTNGDGESWTSNTFGTAWRRSCRQAGIKGVTFHDLRGTAVTRFARAGATEAEIASITGHSLADVGAILDTHYLKRDSNLADAAVRKREQQDFQTKSQTAGTRRHAKTKKNV
ncbi:MAG: tyrosine-type recombinase/integrase [Pacificimonas sp.]